MHRAGLVAPTLLAATTSWLAQNAPVSRGAAEVRLAEDISRIVGQAYANRGAATFLEALTDQVGGRITASPQSQAASELILRTLKEVGYDSAHFEEYTMQSAWQRGPAVGEITSPVHFRLHVGSYGWVPGTNGRVNAPLTDLGSPPGNDLPETKETLRGAAVMVDVRSIGNTPAQVMRGAIAAQLAQAGAVAMLIPSDKPGRMLYTSAYGFYPRAPLPMKARETPR